MKYDIYERIISGIMLGGIVAAVIAACAVAKGQSFPTGYQTNNGYTLLQDGLWWKSGNPYRIKAGRSGYGKWYKGSGYVFERVVQPINRTEVNVQSKNVIQPIQQQGNIATGYAPRQQVYGVRALQPSAAIDTMRVLEMGNTQVHGLIAATSLAGGQYATLSTQAIAGQQALDGDVGTTMLINSMQAFVAQSRASNRPVYVRVDATGAVQPVAAAEASVTAGAELYTQVDAVLQSCIDCHSATAGDGWFDADNFGAYNADQAREVLLAVTAGTATGTIMPKDHDALSVEQIGTLAKWLGALSARAPTQ